MLFANQDCNAVNRVMTLRIAFLLLSLFAATPAFAGPDEEFALLAKRCDMEGTAVSCAAVGAFLWAIEGKKLADCASPFGSVCIRRMEARASAVARVDKLALNFHDKACALGDGEACNKAGVYFAVSYARASDEDAPALAREAEARFEQACKLGSREGCGNVGSTRPIK